MNILLTAINAKYIHSNLAVYSLRAYASDRHKEYREDIQIAEYTINQPLEQILMDLYLRRPDVLCFSCYLWNIRYIEELLAEVGKVLPETEVWLGGPEVSYRSSQLLEKYPRVRGIMRGEGEDTFLELTAHYESGKKDIEEIDGITCRLPDGCIVETPDRTPVDLSTIPFVYEDLENFKNRIIYYESSRGCPFSCSYCLSSIDKCLRFRDIELVKKELQFFLDHEVHQVKFVDRTFNCRHDHALAVWSYLAAHDNGKTNFHFEIAADLLDEEEIALIGTMRPGLIQLEIGVQSTNEETIREIRRKMDFSKVAAVVNKVHVKGNIHQHLDLIAGLPYEDYESFRRSFNDVYALRPQQFQLGFLKVLKGSYMEEKVQDYELLYTDRPPYEVLSTKWLPYRDVVRLKRVEEMVEVYYNSGQFANTLEVLEQEFSDAFSMYEQLGQYYRENNLLDISHTRIARYEILYAFIRGLHTEFVQQYRELLTLDLYLRENVKNRPAFAGEATLTKSEEAGFYDREEQERRYLPGYERYDKRQMRKMTHLERIGGKLLLFDYQNRDIMNQARLVEIGR